LAAEEADISAAQALDGAIIADAVTWVTSVAQAAKTAADGMVDAGLAYITSVAGQLQTLANTAIDAALAESQADDAAGLGLMAAEGAALLVWADGAPSNSITASSGRMRVVWDGSHATFYMEIVDPYGESGTYTLSLSLFGRNTNWAWNGQAGFWLGEQGLVEIGVTRGGLPEGEVGSGAQSVVDWVDDNTDGDLYAIIKNLVKDAQTPQGALKVMIKGNGPLARYSWAYNCIDFANNMAERFERATLRFDPTWSNGLGGL
jgi:hypothetical protein